MSLKAHEARKLANDNDARNVRAFIAGRKRLDERIRLMSKQSIPIYFTKFRLPPYIEGAGTGFDYSKVVSMIYTSLLRDGYIVTWDVDDPATLYVDWSLPEEQQ